uniref:KH RNA binding domain containing, signal transduction associated 3 n=1 Tax=Salarias fasciatus TaxID=181472 RepID=A0A672GE87_SALFA
MHWEIEKIQKDEGKEEEKFIDVVINKNMKLGQKVLIPVKQFPKEYDDGYGTAYDDQGYESYDNYSNQGQNSDDYYEYGHSGESYDSYGQEEWANNRGKAPSARTTKGVYRDQPYSRY